VPTDFWPQTLVGWFTVAGMLSTAVAGVIAFARTIDRLNGFGERLNNHVESSKVLQGRLDAIERGMVLSQADRSNLHESLGRVSTEMQTLMKVAQRTEVTRASDLGEIRERLVRIETKVDRSDVESRERDNKLRG